MYMCKFNVMSQYVLTNSVAGFDYIPVGYVLEFVPSDLLIKCEQIQLVDDHLAETEEWFGIELSAALPSVNVIDSQLLLYIEPSDGMCVAITPRFVMLKYADIFS